MLWRLTLFGLVAAVALGGVATGKPPSEGGPLSEGRELDPVARDSYLPLPKGEVAPARQAEKQGDTVSSFIVALTEALLRELSIPLGTGSSMTNDPPAFQ